MSTIDRNRQSQMNSGLAKKEEAGKDEPKLPVKKNDIREIRKRGQLARVNLDLDSPRMVKAMQICAVIPDDIEKK